MFKRIFVSFFLAVFISLFSFTPILASSYDQGKYGLGKYQEPSAKSPADSSPKDLIDPVATLKTIKGQIYNLQSSFTTNTNWPTFTGNSSEEGKIVFKITKQYGLIPYLNTQISTRKENGNPWYLEMPYALLDGTYDVFIAARDKSENQQEFPLKFELVVKTGIRGRLQLTTTQTTAKSRTGDQNDEEKSRLNLEVKVIDENGKPVEGAKVILFSTPIEKITDKNGIAQFENVEPAKHRLSIASEDQIGEKEIDLSKNQGENVAITVKIAPENWYSPLPVKILIGAFIILLVATIGLLLRRVNASPVVKKKG